MVSLHCVSFLPSSWAKYFRIPLPDSQVSKVLSHLSPVTQVERASKPLLLALYRAVCYTEGSRLNDFGCYCGKQKTLAENTTPCLLNPGAFSLNLEIPIFHPNDHKSGQDSQPSGMPCTQPLGRRKHLEDGYNASLVEFSGLHSLASDHWRPLLRPLPLPRTHCTANSRGISYEHMRFTTCFLLWGFWIHLYGSCKC